MNNETNTTAAATAATAATTAAATAALKRCGHHFCASTIAGVVRDHGEAAVLAASPDLLLGLSVCSGCDIVPLEGDSPLVRRLRELMQTGEEDHLRELAEYAAAEVQAAASRPIHPTTVSAAAADYLRGDSATTVADLLLSSSREEYVLGLTEDYADWRDEHAPTVSSEEMGAALAALIETLVEQLPADQADDSDVDRDVRALHEGVRIEVIEDEYTEQSIAMIVPTGAPDGAPQQETPTMRVGVYDAHLIEIDFLTRGSEHVRPDDGVYEIDLPLRVDASRVAQWALSLSTKLREIHAAFHSADEADTPAAILAAELEAHIERRGLCPELGGQGGLWEAAEWYRHAEPAVTATMTDEQIDALATSEAASALEEEDVVFYFADLVAYMRNRRTELQQEIEDAQPGEYDCAGTVCEGTVSAEGAFCACCIEASKSL